MKPKLILCLALVLSGGLFGCSNIANADGTNAPAKLKINKPWEDCTIKLVVSGASGSTQIKSKCVEYGSRFPLAAIFDPHTQRNYIVSGNQSFYISDNSGMIGCWLAGAELVCRKSYFEIPKSEGDIDVLITRFTSEFDEQKLINQESKSLFRFTLANAAPFQFFTAHSAGGSQPVTPSIKAIDFTNGVLRLDLISEGGTFTGSFWINFKTKKIIKSIVDGQEMNPEKPFGGTLKKI